MTMLVVVRQGNYTTSEYRIPYVIRCDLRNFRWHMVYLCMSNKGQY